MVFNSIIWLATKISEAVETEIAQRREAFMLELRELHKSLENKIISEEEFDLREAAILDALDSLDAMTQSRDPL